jgi:mRNA-degrading endonuclease RelE of RelBE toxin-antitoxin system
MAYTVEFTPDAAQQMRALRATDRAKIADQCMRLLSVNPTLESKSRLKRLREGAFPP